MNIEKKDGILPELTVLPAPPAADWHTLQLQEVAQLRRTIADLLRLTEKNGQIKQRYEAYDKLVPQLRAANEQLVMATFEARDSQAAAEALARRQTEFLSMLAHELRNPLHPIVIVNHLIGQLAGQLPDLSLLHSIIARQVAQLTRLVDDLMDASRASTGKIVIRRCRMALNEAVENAVEACQFIIAGRSQRLQLDAPDQPWFIDGDLARLTQLFSNLLLNASKYAPEHGHITIGIQAEAGQVRIKISDNGAGIPLEIQPFIFDLFTQGPCPPNRAPGGLGIGLSLVRQIAQLHDGSVEVYSPGSGLGSVFTVTLPLALAQPTASAPQPAPHHRSGIPPTPRRILYIEDNLDAGEMLSRVLEMEGHAVTIRTTGPSGLEAAQQGGYDAIIIIDVGLPGLTGYAIARTLRRQGAGAPPCLIGLSGFAAAEPEPAESFSFDHYLMKPVSMTALAAILQQLAPPAPAAPAGAP